jgi:hypothetical protein
MRIQVDETKILLTDITNQLILATDCTINAFILNVTQQLTTYAPKSDGRCSFFPIFPTIIAKKIPQFIDDMETILDNNSGGLQTQKEQLVLAVIKGFFSSLEQEGGAKTKAVLTHILRSSLPLLTGRAPLPLQLAVESESKIDQAVKSFFGWTTT